MADLTREQITALSELELDVAVGTRVMGWENVPEGSVRQLKGTGWYRHPDKPGEYCGMFEDYSTDANAARLVLAEIERRGLWINLINSLLDLGVFQRKAEWYANDIWTALNVAPAAICRAALLAVLPEGGE